MLKIKYRGVKCDRPGCGFKDYSFDSSEYAKWVNKPCPYCQHNLLTKSDCEAAWRNEKLFYWGSWIVVISLLAYILN